MLHNWVLGGVLEERLWELPLSAPELLTCTKNICQHLTITSNFFLNSPFSILLCNSTTKWEVETVLDKY